MKNRPFRARLGFACSGIRTVWRRERSFRTQIGLAVVAIMVVALLRPAFLWVALAVALVLALEMLNSALEYLIEPRTLALSRAKDRIDERFGRNALSLGPQNGERIDRVGTSIALAASPISTNFTNGDERRITDLLQRKNSRPARALAS